ncbi:inactive pancreatic lipase-related protein 1-like [Montipora foliosa]|uniref:inactive pancreatic lipase-related protein 1-like n=1 Tax=Montipora foliosa TaxID=591990 RepID=UPI0035F20E9C
MAVANCNTVVFVFLILVTMGQGFLQGFFQRSVCYTKYGCFKNTADPWRLPQSPSKINTAFYLFTRQNREIPQTIDDENKNKLAASNYNILRHETIFVVHGFKESVAASPWMKPMKDALLDAVDCNVILVDWSKGAATFYFQAAENTRLIGRQIAVLAMFLMSQNNGGPSLGERFYIVGFSLGAHVAGYAGSYLKEHRVTLGRITGLDPAGPHFNKAKKEYRLDKNDATFVDVIHTDAGFAGTTLNMGDADFYPNGGHKQPGCPFVNIQDLGDTLACDHMRAPDYYIATVKGPCHWIAYPCDSYKNFQNGKCLQCQPDGCSRMGYYADPSKSGKFYLNTNKKKPFCDKRP